MALIEMTNVIEGFAGVGNALQFNGVPVSGASGTMVNRAPKGAQLVNSATGIMYVNTGTQASPTWTVVGTQS